MVSVFQKKKMVVGLDVGSTSIKMVLLKEDNGKISVLKAKRVVIDPENREIDLPKALQKALQGVLLKEARVVSVLTDPQGSFLKLSVPQMPRGELREALAWELKEKIPFDMGESEFDFEILQDIVDKGVKKLEILVAVSSKETTREHFSFLRRNDVIPSRVIQGPIALQSLFKKFQSGFDEPTAVLEMGSSMTELSVLQGRGLEFSRRIPVSGEDFTKALLVPIRSEQGVVSLKPEEAEKVKFEYGLCQENLPHLLDRPIPPSQLLPLVRPVAERLSSEIERSLIFYQEQSSGGKVKRLLLSGGGAALKGLDAFLSESLGIEVISCHPFEELPLRGAVEEAVKESPQEFTSALGAALSSESGINLLPQEVKDQTKQLVQRASVKGGLTALVLLLAFVYAGMRIEAENRETKLAVMRLELSALTPVLEGAQQKRVLAELWNGEPYWEDVFRELSHLVPERVYLKRLGWEKGRLTLEGVIVPDEKDPEGLLSKLIFKMEKGIFRNVTLVETEKLKEGEGSIFEIRAEVD